MTLIEELRKFYKFYDHGQGLTLTDTEIDRYHARMLELGRIIYSLNSVGHLVGYVESWRVTTEQVGRIFFDEKFNPLEENVKDGPICFIANVTVRPDFRNGELLKYFRDKVIEANPDAGHICGLASHGKAKAFKIFAKKGVLVND